MKILAVGDSVMWGQGLNTREKFTEQICHWLNAHGKKTELTMLAHSGAIIGGKVKKNDGNGSGGTEVRASVSNSSIHIDEELIDVYEVPWLYGELPRSKPTLYHQVALSAGLGNTQTLLDHRKHDISEQKQYKDQIKTKIKEIQDKGVDLILMNGGANDIGTMNLAIPLTLGEMSNSERINIASAIMNPIGAMNSALLDVISNPDSIILNDSEFETLVKQKVENRMYDLLKFTTSVHSDVPIVLCSYYPVFTAVTDATVSKIAAFCMIFGGFAGLAGIVNAARAKSVLVNRSKLWYELSFEAYKNAAKKINNALGKKLVFVIQPSFNELNGAFCKKSAMFEFDLIGKSDVNSKIVTIDVYDSKQRIRQNAHDTYYGAHPGDKEIDKFLDYRASVGHPNMLGAELYYKAISKKLADIFSL